MRVAVVVYGPLDERSGGFLYDRRVADRLRARGDTVVRVSLPEPRSRAAVGYGLDPRVRRRLAAVETEADVVLVDELCHPSLALAPLPRPAVAVVHHLRASEPGPALVRRADRVLERRFLARCDAYVCNGETTRTTVADLLDRSVEPSVVARPGGDRLREGPPPASPDVPADGPLRVVTVGSVTPRKGHATLIDGLARLSAPWRLDVVGSEPRPGYAAALRARAAAHGVAGRVRFHGRLPDAALRDRLRRADVFAQPSTYEGYGIAALEAMGEGLPAVVTSAGGPREFVRDGENGALVDPGDVAGVAAALERYATDRERLRAAARAAAATARAHPTWAETGDRVRAFLRAI